MIAPYESRVFEQYWYPIRDIGDVKNATVNAALNVEKRNDNLFFGFNVTGKFEKAKVSVTNKGAVVFEDICDMTPASAYIKEIPMAEMKLEDITVSLTSNDGETLVEYTTYVRGRKRRSPPESLFCALAKSKLLRSFILTDFTLNSTSSITTMPVTIIWKG